MKQYTIRKNNMKSYTKNENFQKPYSLTSEVRWIRKTFFNILFIIMDLEIVDETFFKSRCVVNGITERLLLYISIIPEFFFRLHLLDKNSVTPIFLFESSFLLIEQLIIPATFLSNANLWAKVRDWFINLEELSLESKNGLLNFTLIFIIFKQKSLYSVFNE